MTSLYKRDNSYYTLTNGVLRYAGCDKVQRVICYDIVTHTIAVNIGLVLVGNNYKVKS